MTHRIDNQRSLTMTGHLVNGGLSTGVMLLALQPLNTVKTYIMTGKGMPPFSALYRGMTPIAVSHMTIQSLSFFTHGYLVNRYFRGNRENMNDKQKIMVGSAAALSTSPISSIFDRIMILCQVNKESPSVTIKKLINNSGIRALGKGYTPSLLRDLFFSTALWAFTDIFTKSIRRQLPSNWDNRDVISSFMGKLSAGALSGALSTPVDVVKTRMQADVRDKYQSTLQTIVHLAENEGFKVFYKGIWIRTSLISLSILILGYSKEKIPSFFPQNFFKN